MLKPFSRLAGLTLLFGTLITSAAYADTRFDVRIGVPGRPVVAYAPPPVYSGYVWQPGYYVWAGYRRHWVAGRWIRPAYGSRGYDRRDWRGDRRWEHRDRRDRDWRR